MNSVLKLEIKNSNNSTAEWCKKMYPYPTETLIELLDDSQIMRDAGFDVHCQIRLLFQPIQLVIKSRLELKFVVIWYLTVGHTGCLVNLLALNCGQRSSCGSKTPLRLANSIELIDSGYRGELIAIVDNLGSTDVHINQGDRLFQLVAPGHSQFIIRF